MQGGLGEEIPWFGGSEASDMDGRESTNLRTSIFSQIYIVFCKILSTTNSDFIEGVLIPRQEMESGRYKTDQTSRIIKPGERGEKKDIAGKETGGRKRE